MKPLAGLKVLDFSKTLAGPLCTQSLGDQGADVIKVESVGQGDETRSWPPFPAPGLGAFFLSANRNKRSIALDLKTEAGQRIARDLARNADVVVESFSTGVAERLGIDAPTLQAQNDRLIYCSISGFGRSGPLKNSPGYDVILQAFSGVMALTGDEGGGFIRSPISPIDQTTAVHAFSGILTALLQRQQTGKGSIIKVSLLETAIGLLGYNLQSYWQTGVQPPKCGSGHESLCPYQAFEASDGPLMIGVANDNLWRKFCKVAGLEDIVDDPRFRTNADRARNRAETLHYVKAAVARRSVAWWDESLAAIGVPCSPINSLSDLLTHPHIASTGMITEYEHPVAGRLRSIAQPVLMNDAPRDAGRPPPTLGQHTDEVLREMGIPAEELERLRRSKIVG
jgi:formyl-CoA transferase